MIGSPGIAADIALWGFWILLGVGVLRGELRAKLLRFDGATFPCGLLGGEVGRRLVIERAIEHMLARVAAAVDDGRFAGLPDNPYPVCAALRTYK